MRRSCSFQGFIRISNVSPLALDEPMFHSWVYVHFDFGGENATSFFVESTTGERRALGDERYTSINCLWNQVGRSGVWRAVSSPFD